MHSLTQKLNPNKLDKKLFLRLNAIARQGDTFSLFQEKDQFTMTFRDMTERSLVRVSVNEAGTIVSVHADGEEVAWVRMKEGGRFVLIDHRKSKNSSPSRRRKQTARR